MLYAVINPAAKYITKASPFAAPLEVEANIMTATARPYILGAKQTRFEVNFGIPKKDDKGIIIGFEKAGSETVLLTAEELANWANDDTVVLSLIAKKYDTVVKSTGTIASGMMM